MQENQFLLFLNHLRLPYSIPKSFALLLNIHVARHSFAINALNDKDNPLDMYQVSRLLGHSSTDETEKVYADYTAETLGDKLRTLNFNYIPNFK